MPETEDPLPPLRDVIRDYDLRASKVLGQNFILDLNLTRRIARTAGQSGSSPLNKILEIGPGPGGLTRGLLMESADHVTVIEADERFRPALEDISKAYPEKLSVVMGDALKINPNEIFEGGYKIVANLPYNIATPLLIKWLSQSPIRWDSLTLMFQKEVAQRICAQPGDDAYGRLAVLSNWLADTTIEFDISADVFVPPPKVTSTIVTLVPREQPLAEADLSILEKVTAAAFGQRRKMLRASLKQITPEAESILLACNIDPTRRAETLTIEEFCALSRALKEYL
ncbi:MAG: 16S rRNA (adenine(1518)-N(6)/adenine(1519)-N(6))-dimethyltransferase [Alphaproteobacteria bacterium TMED110]|nr:16S rRNA (adenine(1518)-N(6)/adenine(1519)-N(6))-dimethyltransferase [Hyphomicrobiales bacterium]OUV50119.1 MAG: 16S rRNA (adenine(1518)-N(6)/adenine(1519)-N(6))-dimethyltransferase [Alphaproteobacteria bacterium TMED110]